jgi:ProP effector
MNARLTPQNHLHAEELLQQFMQQFPNAFINPVIAAVIPLKLNIHKELQAIFANQHSHKAIARALSLYVNTPEYNQSLQPGAVRVDLSGQPCGEVTLQQAQHPKDRYQRFLKRTQRILQRHQHPIVPNLDACAVDTLVRGHLDLVIKITSLPQYSRTRLNGWQELHFEADGRLIQVAVRPKVWRKLQQMSEHSRYWIAIIRGKKGMNIGHNGFELLEPLVQIFERHASEYEVSQIHAPANPAVKTPNVGLPQSHAMASNSGGCHYPTTLHLKSGNNK